MSDESSSDASWHSRQLENVKQSGAKQLKEVAKGHHVLGLVYWLAVSLLLYDAFRAFPRAAGSLSAALIMYSVLAVIVWFMLRNASNTRYLSRSLIVAVVVMVFVPLLGALAAGPLARLLGNIPFFSTATPLIIQWWVPLIIAYFAGLPGFVARLIEGMDSWITKSARFIHAVASVLVLLAVLLPIGAGLADAVGPTTAAVPLDAVSPMDMLSSMWGVVSSAGSSVWGGVTSQYNESFAHATQRAYTGQVERQQGRPLGVFLRDVQPARRTYSFDVHNDSLEVAGGEEQVLWFGRIEWSTFAEAMNISVGCLYEYPIRGSDARGSIEGIARPSDPITARFTGSESEVADFDCRVNLDEVLAQAGEYGATRGEFYTTIDFPFETWGYATLTFMESGYVTELLRDGRSPAQVLGLSRYVDALYTPGPLSLGMFDRQPLPLRVDVQDERSNFLPSFGVTLRNAWMGRGEVSSFDELVLQVPDVFVLTTTGTSPCAGYTGKPEVYTSSYQGDVIPDGYRWYVFTNMNSSSDSSVQQTIRCEMKPRGDDWGLLLHPDLSARQFTFVARASYNYHLRSRVPVSIGVSRI